MLSTWNEAPTSPETPKASTRPDVSGLSDNAELKEILESIVASTAALDSMLARLRMEAALYRAPRLHERRDVNEFVGESITTADER